MLIDPRAGLGPLYYLCPDCKGSGGRRAQGPKPVMVETKGERGKRTYAPLANETKDGRCVRCCGAGLILEDRCKPLGRRIAACT